MAMRMTKLYRLEHPVTGDGVFATTGENKDVNVAIGEIFNIASKLRHPSPQEDVHPKYYERFWNRDYFCACPDMESLMKWFTVEIIDIVTKEFNLIEITIPKKLVRFGMSGIQAFYRKEDIQSVKILKHCL